MLVFYLFLDSFFMTVVPFPLDSDDLEIYSALGSVLFLTLIDFWSGVSLAAL